MFVLLCSALSPLPSSKGGKKSNNKRNGKQRKRTGAKSGKGGGGGKSDRAVARKLARAQVGRLDSAVKASALSENADQALLVSETVNAANTDLAYDGEAAQYIVWFRNHATLKPIAKGSKHAPHAERIVFDDGLRLWLGYGRTDDYGKTGKDGMPLMDERALSVRKMERLSASAKAGQVHDGLSHKTILSKLSALQHYYNKESAVNFPGSKDVDTLENPFERGYYKSQLKQVIKKVKKLEVKSAVEMPVGQVGDVFTPQHNDELMNQFRERTATDTITTELRTEVAAKLEVAGGKVVGSRSDNRKKFTLSQVWCVICVCCACCVLCAVCCVLCVACWLLRAACCVLRAACCVLHTGCYCTNTLLIVNCLLCFSCCMLLIECCILHKACLHACCVIHGFPLCCFACLVV